MAENKNIETTTTTELARANRIAVQSTDTGYKAEFYRTHKHLATLWSEETTWQADESANKSAQREDFRRYAIEHADAVGILWNPADLRTTDNKRIPKYENDEMLRKDAVDLLWADLFELVQGCNLGVEMGILSADTISPVSHSAKGTDLSKLGILDGKYEKSGNWAWADIEMSLTLTKDGQEIYYTTTCQLVSGQLKKPHLTKTAFVEDIRKSLEEAGLLPTEEAKAETPAEETKQEEVQAEEKPKAKKTTKKSKK